ncbi:MAG TPA: DUF1508 domain-containing protein [Thermomonas sp.]|nr:DUF1508 domain-containing protein [Thermomonas sp.]
MSEHRAHFQVYRDSRGDWRWRLVAGNGLTVADSGEGYASRFNVKRSIRGFCEAVTGMPLGDLRVVEVEG